MQAQAYEGYFCDGLFHTADKKIKIPERRRVYLTVFEESDEPTNDSSPHNLLDLFGKIQFAEGYDYKAMRGDVS